MIAGESQELFPHTECVVPHNEVVQCLRNQELFPHTECVVPHNEVVQCLRNQELFPHTECVVLHNEVVQVLILWNLVVFHISCTNKEGLIIYTAY